MRIEGTQPASEGPRAVREVSEVRRSPEVAREAEEGRAGRAHEGAVVREPHRAGEAERAQDGRADPRQEREPDRVDVSREGLARLRSEADGESEGLGRRLTE